MSFLIEQTGEYVYFVLGLSGGIVLYAFADKVIRSTKTGAKIRKQVKPIFICSFLIAFLAFLYAVALCGGLLEDWEPIGKPLTEDQPLEVVEDGVIKTESGELFIYLGDGHWEKTDPGSLDEYWDFYDGDPYIPNPGNCATLPFLPLEVRKYVDMKTFCIHWGPGLAKTAYAIDYRGSVYHWANYVGEFRGIEIVFYPIFTILLCLVIGFVFTGLVRLIFLIRSRMDNSGQ